MDDFKKKLELLESENLIRTMKYLDSPQDKIANVDGRDILIMSSNNYLGLANDKSVVKEAINAIKKYGVGSGGSRLTTGSYNPHRMLEEKLSDFFKREDSIIFNTGYTANLSVIQSVCDETYTVISDEENHASIIDGIRISKAKKLIFRHNDMEDLESRLKVADTKNVLIITEGVFSMSGDLANLKEIARLSKKYNAKLMVDDAHGIGVLGKTGRGVLEHFNLNEEIDIYMGTLSKAIGVEGGFVSGNESFIKFLKNKARGFVYSTAIAPHLCLASIKALELMDSGNLSKALSDNILYFEKIFKPIFKDLNCNSAIIKIPIGDEKKAFMISEKLLAQGVLIPAIRYPTVKKGEAILRVCLMSTHTKEDINNVYEIIRKILN